MRLMTCFFGLGLVVLMLIASASADPAERHLPFMAGDTWWCSQDWNECPGTHCEEKAWDFNYGSGSDDLGYPLLAPASGVVAYASDTYGGFGKVLLIEYADGTFDRIAHCNGLVVQKQENGAHVNSCVNWFFKQRVFRPDCSSFS